MTDDVEYDLPALLDQMCTVRVKHAAGDAYYEEGPTPDPRPTYAIPGGARAEIVGFILEKRKELASDGTEWEEFDVFVVTRKA